jgi:hypothetical protein
MVRRITREGLARLVRSEVRRLRENVGQDDEVAAASYELAQLVGEKAGWSQSRSDSFADELGRFISSKTR